MTQPAALNRPQSLNRSYIAPGVVNQRLQTLLALNPQAGERVLDVGCGTGFLCHDLALQVGRAGRVTAVDLQQSMVDATRRRCAHLPQVETHVGDVGQLPFEEAAFDAVACTQVLLYVEDVAQSIDEMRRVLKPNGRMAVLETDWQGAVMHSRLPAITDKIMRAWDQAVPSPNLPRRIGALLKLHGFHALRCQAIPILETSYSSGAFSVHSIDWLSACACKQGAISQREAREWKADLQQLGEQGAYFFCVNRFLFTAVKTGG